MATVQEVLNSANPNVICEGLRAISFGSIIAGLVPRLVQRTGLASSATQVHNAPGIILQVQDAAGTTALSIVNSTAGAGEVQVTYDSNGIATLVFGDGANTGYDCICTVLPAGLATALAADSGAAF